MAVDEHVGSGSMAGMPSDPTPPRPPDHRPVRAIIDDLATVERYLVDAPPHSGQGHRTELRAKLDRLKRELAAIDAERRSR